MYYNKMTFKNLGELIEANKKLREELKKMNKEPMLTKSAKRCTIFNNHFTAMVAGLDES